MDYNMNFGDGQNHFDGWTTEPERLAELSLEEVVDRGETPHDQEKDYAYVTLHSCPASLQGLIFGLKGKHPGLGTGSSVQRFVTKLGAAKIAKEPEVQEISEKKSQFFSQASELELTFSFIPRYYRFRQRIFSVKGGRISCCTFWWINGELDNLASILSLSKSCIATLALIVGLSRSTKWVPEPFRKQCKAEFEEFVTWLRKEWWHKL